jgi:predicted SprT family Zn-dependent metalloprotease
MKFRGAIDTDVEREITKVHAAAMVKLAAADMVPEGLEALTVQLNPTMRTCAGRAFTRQVRVDLHYRLLKDNSAHLELTYLHELAHIISTLKYGRPGSGHGALWKKVMRVLEANDERCHNLDVSAYKRRQTRYLYICDNSACGRHVRPIQLSAARHNKMERCAADYRCPGCRSELVYNAETVKE